MNNLDVVTMKGSSVDRYANKIDELERLGVDTSGRG